MATLAAYPEWYDRSGNVVPRQDITEVEVTNSYTQTGNEVASWDASASMDGSIMCHIVGTKLTIVWNGLTVIPAQMFFQFLSLETISGLSAVTTIGERAFCYTPKISSIDIDPTKLTSIGAHAFRLSSAEDNLDLSGVSLDIVGDMATRLKRWGAKNLSEIQGIAFPRTICLDVPHSENQGNYPDITFRKVDGVEKTVAESGCAAVSCYHIWNAINAGTDKEYANFLDWFNATLNRNDDWADTYNNTLNELVSAIGWTVKTPSNILANDDNGITALDAILSKLNNGLPAFAHIWSTNTLGGAHDICIVGCDADTRKIAVMDSAVFGDTGVLSWLAFEDIFNDGNDNDKVWNVGYNQPVMASGSTWFTRGGVASSTRETITEIAIVDEYTPTGNETAWWDASAEEDGCVMAYIEGAKLTIAGNGYGCIYAHPDSSSAFADPANNNPFNAVTSIRGLDILNTRRAQTFKRMFNGCNRLVSADVANWNTSACIDMTAMFQNCHSLKVLDLSKWDVSKVTNMNGMFQSSVDSAYMQLETIGDVGNWNTAKVEGMQQMFKLCGYLKELNMSGWDTSKVQNKGLFLNKAVRLEKFTIGENFNFAAFASSNFPAPSSDYIQYADGKWYDYDYNAYTPTEIPSPSNGTYYASKFLAADDDDSMVFIRNGTLRKLAVAIRHKNEKTDEMYPSEFAEEVLAL